MYSGTDSGAGEGAREGAGREESKEEMTPHSVVETIYIKTSELPEDLSQLKRLISEYDDVLYNETKERIYTCFLCKDLDSRDECDSECEKNNSKYPVYSVVSYINKIYALYIKYLSEKIEHFMSLGCYTQKYDKSFFLTWFKENFDISDAYYKDTPNDERKKIFKEAVEKYMLFFHSAISKLYDHNALLSVFNIDMQCLQDYCEDIA